MHGVKNIKIIWSVKWFWNCYVLIGGQKWQNVTSALRCKRTKKYKI